MLKDGEALYRRLTHRPINPESESSKAFKEDLQRMVNEFRITYPMALEIESINTGV